MRPKKGAAVDQERVSFLAATQSIEAECAHLVWGRGGEQQHTKRTATHQKNSTAPEKSKTQTAGPLPTHASSPPGPASSTVFPSVSVALPSSKSRRRSSLLREANTDPPPPPPPVVAITTESRRVPRNCFRASALCASVPPPPPPPPHPSGARWRNWSKISFPNCPAAAATRGDQRHSRWRQSIFAAWTATHLPGDRVQLLLQLAHALPAGDALARCPGSVVGQATIVQPCSQLDQSGKNSNPPKEQQHTKRTAP